MSDQSQTADGGRRQKRDFDEWWADQSLPGKIGMGFLFAIGGAGLLALFGLVVMALWNWLMPEIFGLKQITYWQAWGVLVLCCILFKNCNMSNSESKSDRRRKRELRRHMQESDDTQTGSGDVDEATGGTGPNAGSEDLPGNFGSGSAPESTM
jgi:hypothetical protein